MEDLILLSKENKEGWGELVKKLLKFVDLLLKHSIIHFKQ